jgi:hypothetical protein
MWLAVEILKSEAQPVPVLLCLRSTKTGHIFRYLDFALPPSSMQMPNSETTPVDMNLQNHAEAKTKTQKLMLHTLGGRPTDIDRHAATHSHWIPIPINHLSTRVSSRGKYVSHLSVII